MRPAERITIIKEIAEILSTEDWSGIDLALREYGLPISNTWGGGKYDYIIQMLDGAESDTLNDLHRFVTDTAITPAADQGPWRSGHLRLFMSHLATYEQFVGYVSGNLGRYGINGFVAHKSIKPSEDWQAVIDAALASCDVMIVFMHDGFHQSDWCDQEVGFGLARGIPILPLAIGMMPYGLMGKLQAQKIYSSEQPHEVAAKIMRWLETQASIRPRLTESLVSEFEQSGSFDQTRRLWDVISRMDEFTPEQLKRLKDASENNGEIRDAQINWTPGPTVVSRFIASKSSA